MARPPGRPARARCGPPRVGCPVARRLRRRGRSSALLDAGLLADRGLGASLRVAADGGPGAPGSCWSPGWRSRRACRGGRSRWPATCVLVLAPVARAGRRRCVGWSVDERARVRRGGSSRRSSPVVAALAVRRRPPARAGCPRGPCARAARWPRQAVGARRVDGLPRARSGADGRRRAPVRRRRVRADPRWSAGPVSALVIADLVVLRRSARHVVQLVVAALVPVLVGARPAAGQPARRACSRLLVGGLRRDERDRRGRPARGDGAGPRPAAARSTPSTVRRLRMVVPAAAMLLWSRRRVRRGRRWSGAPTCRGWIALGRGRRRPVWAAAAVRAAYRPAPDWGGPAGLDPDGRAADGCRRGARPRPGRRRARPAAGRSSVLLRIGQRRPCSSSQIALAVDRGRGRLVASAPTLADGAAARTPPEQERAGARGDADRGGHGRRSRRSRCRARAPGRRASACARRCSRGSSTSACVDGARVLDLYAGSGALGLEAASRGAAHVVARRVRAAAPPRCAGATSTTLGLAAACGWSPSGSSGSLRARRRRPWDLVLARPAVRPARRPTWPRCWPASAGALTPDAVVVVERCVAHARSRPGRPALVRFDERRVRRHASCGSPSHATARSAGTRAGARPRGPDAGRGLPWPGEHRRLPRVVRPGHARPPRRRPPRARDLFDEVVVGVATQLGQGAAAAASSERVALARDAVAGPGRRAGRARSPGCSPTSAARWVRPRSSRACAAAPTSTPSCRWR